jgi:2-methylcitrate dehydratase
MAEDRFQTLLARYATGAPAAPPEARHEVKRRMLDSLGVMAAAAGSPTCRAVRAYAGRLPLADGARLFGTDLAVAPEAAALANGAHVRYLDFNDTYLSLEPLHPSDSIPALTALAEWRGRPGSALIDAIALAYEVGMDLCDAASLRVHGWDHVNYIALATAAAAARLLELDEAGATQALALALVPSAAMRQTRAGELSMWKGVAAANAARNGLFAALLAAEGLTGPAEPFVGEMGIFRQLLGGEPFREEALARLAGQAPPARIVDSYIKAYPVEYHAQSAVDVARELRDEIGDPARVERIEIETFKLAWEIIARDPEKWRPRTRETADHSRSYTIAAGLAEAEAMLAASWRLDEISARELTASWPRGLE